MSAYAFEHNGNVFTPDGKAPIADVHAHNAAIESSELAAWSTCPDGVLAYYKMGEGSRWDSLHLYSAGTLQDCIVTTWLGTKIGRIVKANGYRHNFGGRFVSMTVIGTNGALYHGRASWDNGNAIRLRLSKQ